MPSLTIGIPTYNRSACVVQTVQRLLHNSDMGFELIVSDNASEDDTIQRLGELSDGRLRTVRQSENLGACANFSFLLDQAKGDYFILHQDDDAVSSDFLSAFSALASEVPNLELFATSYWRGNPHRGYRSRAFGTLTKRLPELAEPSTPIVLPGKEVAPLLLLDMPFINPGSRTGQRPCAALGDSIPTRPGGETLSSTRGCSSRVCVAMYACHTRSIRSMPRTTPEVWRGQPGCNGTGGCTKPWSRISKGGVSTGAA